MNSKIVVIGNGPSLRGFDFTTLSNVDALGMNAAYRYWDRINWYPTHYCCLDVELIATHHEAIRRLVEENQVKTAFLNESFLEFFPDAGKDKRYVFLNQFSRKWCDEVGSKYGIVWQEGNAFKSSQPGKVTTGAYSVRYAIHLGYKDIGLIGIDLKYVEQIPEATLKGGIQLVMEKTPDHNPNYFFDDYQQAGDRFQVPNPEVHNFDLHPVSFEVLRDDIVLRDFNVSVVNCNTRSELHARGTFPYTAIEDFIHRQKLGALVIPTQVRERDRILNNLKLWQKPAFIPFLNFKSYERLRLVFTFTGHEDEVLKAEILHEYSKSSILKKCFYEPEFHFFLLPEGEDVYVRDKNTPISDKGLKSGPNQQFFHSLFAMKGLCDHVFFMETDCLPIRPDWLGKLCELVQESEDFWILGSHYRGKLPVPKHFARHINGSAVYAVGNEEFIEFAKTWQATLDKVISTRDKTLAYDCVLEHFFYYDFQTNIEQQRALDPESDGWKLFQRVASKLRYSDYTLNYSGKVDVETANLSFLRFIREKFNNSYIIHNRKICEDIYQFALGQSPTVNVESTSPKQNDLRNDSHESHASSEQLSKESIVVSVNPDAVDEIGHFLSYEDLLHGTFQKLGIQYISLCNRSLKADLLAQRNFIRPVLTVNSWTIGNCRGRGAEPDDSVKQTSKQELIQAVKEIIQKSPESDLILYLYCGSLYHAEIFVEILQAYPNVRGVITLFWLSFTDISDAAFLPRWQHLLTHCANERRIDLSVMTEEMQADLLSYTGFHLPVFPHPSTTIDDAMFLRLKSEPLEGRSVPPNQFTILFPGSLLPNKGYEFTIETLKGLSEYIKNNKSYSIRCIVRHPKPERTSPSVQKFIDEVRNYSEVLEGALEKDNLVDLIRNSHIIVLPYLPDSYSKQKHGVLAFSKRTSGLLIDAIHCGIPVVAFSETWLGNLINQLHCGIAVNELTGSALVEAIVNILKDYPAYSKATYHASTTFFLKNNWTSLAGAIMGATASSYADSGVYSITNGSSTFNLHSQSSLSSAAERSLSVLEEAPNFPEAAAIARKPFKTDPPSALYRTSQTSMSTSASQGRASVHHDGTSSNGSVSLDMNGQTSQSNGSHPKETSASSEPLLSSNPPLDNGSVERTNYLLKRIVRYYRRWPLGVAVLAIACNCLGMIEEIPFRWAFTGGGTALTLLLVGHAATRSDRVIESAQNTADQAKAIAKGTRGKARLAYRQGNRALQRVKLARQEAIEASSHAQKLEGSLAALNATTLSTARSITHANERLYNVENLTQTALKTGEKALGLAGQSSDNLALTTDNLALTTKKLNRVAETLEKVERSQTGTQRTASNAMATASYALDQANRAAVCLDLPSKTFHQTIQTLPKLEKTLFYFGHHKCATNWVRPVLYDVCERHKWSYAVEGGTNNALLYLEAPVLIQCHVNATTDYLHLMLQGKNSRGFHLIRDPRDVLVSQYWSWRNNHSVNDTTVLSLRRKLLDLSTEEGLLELIPHIRMIQQIQNWPFGQIASILEVKYEDLIEAPSFHFRQIFDHLEIEFNSDELSKLVDKHSFAKRSGRPLGSEDINSHLRQGLPGNWRDYFTDTLKQAFQEQYGDLLIQLGYEKDSNW
ncbi:sulfotransferase domain-containing protein [Vacuolonema iberomarrocanum]|uniref:sulfotransferase domain-containing protein n=1 Tax=Vacuolonema iberomarrocanum TaxID=3454632 RepID=UPI0019F2F38B|nr:sulfotransferase domain-containing protein [filamentous cyanobacterium LEGE 07170]